MAKDQEDFKKIWVDVSSALNESVPVGFTDYCRDLVLYQLWGLAFINPRLN
jgi:hypothetical protein